jgi:hypothetical protein
MISPDINWSQNDTVNPSVQLYGATKHGSFKRPEIKNKIEFACHPKQNKTGRQLNKNIQFRCT